MKHDHKHTHTHTKYMNSNVNVSMQQIHGKSYGMLCWYICLLLTSSTLCFKLSLSCIGWSIRSEDCRHRLVRIIIYNKVCMKCVYCVVNDHDNHY